jgi:hypothetical protein
MRAMAECLLKKLLGHWVGEAWYGAQALREAIVVVVATHAIDLVVILCGLVAVKRRGVSRIDSLLAAAEANGGTCWASDTFANPRKDFILERTGAGFAHRPGAHLTVKHDYDWFHTRYFWCSCPMLPSLCRHKLARIEIKRLEEHFLERVKEA